MRSFLVYITLLSFGISFSQTQEQRQAISKKYNIEKLTELSLQYSKSYNSKREKALQLAQINDWRIRYKENNITYELREVTEDGFPLYYTTHNVNAAKSTRTNHLNSAGSLGLNLEGQNMTIHAWDNGHALSTHQEFDGIGGENRHSKGDTWSGITLHNTHIMGTLIASGVNENAKGMAPQAQGISYHWINDIPKMVEVAGSGMLVSNHSYGDNAGASNDKSFGAYLTRSEECDEIMRNASYYLVVVSAGNEGLNNSCNAEPINGNPQYDKLTDLSTCKNGLTVANALDAEVTSDGTLINVLINANSSQGPTDDFRIKPDISGNGTGIYSCIDTNNNSYEYESGTSMAAPNVAGSLLLLQQHHNNSYGTFMKAATLKGLALHTADDMGMTGPDTESGWGLLNAKVAAQTISNKNVESLILEENIISGESFSITVQSDNTNPLLTSISWTDLPGHGVAAGGNISNDPTPQLRNDLDLRVSNGTEYKPWKLIDVDANIKGDNNVDPYERVDINEANGSYTISITTDQMESDQDFSLIITGITSHDLCFNPIKSINEVCNFNDAIFDFSFIPQTGEIVSETNFSAQNIPDGAQVTFTNTENRVQMLLSNLQNVTPGEYIIDVTASNNGQSVIKKVTLLLRGSTLINPNLSYPKHNSIFDSEQEIVLEWIGNQSDEPQYNIQIATDPNFDFDSIVYSTLVNDTQCSFVTSDYDTFYWRVRNQGFCTVSDFSSVYQFTITPCVFFKTSDGSLLIPDINNATGLQTYYNCPNEFDTNEIALNLKISHNDIGSLLVRLTSPSGTSIDIMTPDVDCSAENIASSFRDSSQNNMFCEYTEHNYLSNNLKPTELFANFLGEFTGGIWELSIKNVNSESTGILEEWGLVFCEEQIFDSDSILNIWPNPSESIVNLSFISEKNQDATLNIYDISGRFVQQYVFNASIYRFFRESVDLSHLSNGIYQLQIINGKNIFSDKLLIK